VLGGALRAVGERRAQRLGVDAGPAQQRADRRAGRVADDDAPAGAPAELRVEALLQAPFSARAYGRDGVSGASPSTRATPEIPASRPVRPLLSLRRRTTASTNCFGPAPRTART
jgi:hypothetical protein